MTRSTTFRHVSAAAAWLVGLAGCSADGIAPAGAQLGPTTLLEAVLAGDADAVREHVAQGAYVDAPEVDGTTPLMRAIHGRSPEIAAILINAGADVAAANRFGVNPLYLAARGKDTQTVRALLAAGARASSALPNGETALMTAAKAGNGEIVRALLGRPDLFGEAVDSATSGYSVAARVVELQDGADPNAKERWHGQTALMWAAAEGHAEIVRLLIEAGANVDDRSTLRNAEQSDGDSMQSSLMDADTPQGGFTALHFAARAGHLESARVLIESGGEVNAADQHGATPLLLAALNGHANTAAALLDAGADIDAANALGATALHVATLRGFVDVVDLLAGRGADLTARNSKGHTPLDIATGVTDEAVAPNEAAAAVLRRHLPGS